MHLGRLVLSSALAFCVAAPGLAQGVSNAEADNAAKLAMLLGRGVGCDLDTGRANRMIGAWLDNTFPPGSARQDIYMDLFADSVRHHAAQQRAGKSPDSCADVEEAFSTMNW